MRSYVARSSSRNSRPSPARSLSYQWYAAAASRSARGSATSRYSVTDRDSPGDRVRRERAAPGRSEEHTSELQSHHDLVCRLLLEKKKNKCNRKNLKA